MSGPLTLGDDAYIIGFSLIVDDRRDSLFGTESYGATGIIIYYKKESDTGADINKEYEKLVYNYDRDTTDYLTPGTLDKLKLKGTKKCPAN